MTGPRARLNRRSGTSWPDLKKASHRSQARLQAAVALAKVGSDAVPVLVEALKKGPLQTRLFAGEMMVLLVEPGKVDAATRADLEQFLKNEDDFVREFAIKALSRLGGLDKLKQARHILEKDPSRDIRRVMAAALNGELRDNASAIRKALAEFDPAAIDSARLGQPAPDFVTDRHRGQGRSPESIPRTQDRRSPVPGRGRLTGLTGPNRAVAWPAKGIRTTQRPGVGRASRDG